MLSKEKVSVYHSKSASDLKVFSSEISNYQ